MNRAMRRIAAVAIGVCGTRTAAISAAIVNVLISTSGRLVVASGSSGTPTPLPNEVLQITKTISQGAMEAKRQADAAGPLRQHNDRNKWTLQWYTSHYSHHAAEWATIATGNSRLRAAFAFLVASFARPTARLRLRWF